jgi:hypothetical protein
VGSRTNAAGVLLWSIHQVLRLLAGLLEVVGGLGLLMLELVLVLVLGRNAIGVGREGCRRVCRAIAVSRCIHPERLPTIGRLAFRCAVIGQDRTCD